jgi:hypothetical protein
MSNARYVAGGVLVCVLWHGLADAGPAIPPTPLPAPGGATVHVSTVAQLQNAVAAIASNTTIIIAAGTYQLTSTLYINGSFTNVGIRGATANRNDVVIVGRGMNAPGDGGVPFGIWVGGDVRGVTIANLTIRDVFNHPIMLNAGAQSPFIHNVRLVNAGQQFLKANPNGTGGGVDNGIVEYSVFEYETVSRDDYTNGVDVHTGDNWIIRHNLFRNLRAAEGLAGPAILMWNGSINSLVDGNTFIECQREIALGLVERTPNDHTGGVIRNNFIFRSLPGDVAIYVADSPGTQVVHNSIVISRTYPNPIEFRFPHTTATVVANNVVDGSIVARDGATGSVTGNYTSATAALFANAALGDLHLTPPSTVLLNQVTTVPASAPLDWDGQPRPAGAADIGADEFVVSFAGFTDAALTAGATVIRAVHVTELRVRIDALRNRFGLVAFNWTDPSLGAGTIARALHLADLRTAIAQAYVAAGRAAPTFSNPTLSPQSSVIRAVHIIELREAVVALEGS